MVLVLHQHPYCFADWCIPLCLTSLIAYIYIIMSESTGTTSRAYASFVPTWQRFNISDGLSPSGTTNGGGNSGKSNGGGKPVTESAPAPAPEDTTVTSTVSASTTTPEKVQVTTCPETWPETGDSCSGDLRCEYGSESCCGQTYTSYVCDVMTELLGATIPVGTGPCHGTSLALIFVSTLTFSHILHRYMHGPLV